TRIDKGQRAVRTFSNQQAICSNRNFATRLVIAEDAAPVYYQISRVPNRNSLDDVGIKMISIRSHGDLWGSMIVSTICIQLAQNEIPWACTSMSARWRPINHEMTLCCRR